MLPPTLVDSYRRYKRDTDSVASWLASTAKTNGYSLEAQESSVTPKGSARLKGKARAQAKKGTGAAASANPAVTGPHYIIKLNQFIPLAEYIVASKPKIPVPPSLDSTLKRVIAARSGFAGELELFGATRNELSDASHGFFVSILRKVHDVLKPRLISTKVHTSTNSTPSASREVPTNKFAGLKVYGTSDDFLDAPNTERPGKVKMDKATYEAEPQSSLEDVLYALGMVVIDLEKVRSRIGWVWSNYRDGLLDLVTASVSTNTAIDLAKNLMEEVEPLFKHHGGIWKVMTKFYLLQCLIQGYDAQNLSTGDAEDNFNYATYDVSDKTFMSACRLITEFSKAIQPGSIPMYKDGTYGIYDPRRDRATMSGRQKNQEDQILVYTFFTELMAVNIAILGYPVKDEFLRGTAEMTETGNIPFYLVFATQVFLDIHYTLRQNAKEPSQTLLKQLSIFDDETNKYFNLHANLKIKHWPESNDQMLRQLRAAIKYISNDPVYGWKLEWYRERGIPMPSSVQRHRIVEMSPVLSGLLLYHFRAQVHEFGVAVTNAWGSITYPLHLYHALKNEKLLRTAWPDMDLLSATLTEDNFYVGGMPSNRADYLKRFCLQMGTTVAAFTNNRRADISMFSRTGPRGIKDGTPVSCMFKNRYVYNTGSVNWSPEDVARIIHLGLWEVEELGNDGHFRLTQIDDPQKLREKAAAKRGKKLPEGTALSIDQLVKGLTFALEGEAMELSFPWLAMHQECWELLREVKSRCHQTLCEIFTSQYYEKETQLPWVIAWIFRAAVDEQDTRPLAQAAEAVDRFAESKGSNVSDLLSNLGFHVKLSPVE
ncbi:hypothetical protein F4778DRAFT_785533 [Xylariomycetidae sp. FL2044]|nr:hypothetical protein F4778DRAFT_785533 [Xylariomycetidae sp. FL2044]